MRRTEIDLEVGEVTEFEQKVLINESGTVHLVDLSETALPEGFKTLSAADVDELLALNNRRLFQLEIETAIQNKLDTVAISWGYDDMRSAVSYADEPAVPKFQAEGKALRAWRSLIWAAAGQLLAEFQSSPVAITSIGQVLAQLPQAPDRDELELSN
jgi:hypothetical protein